MLGQRIISAILGIPLIILAVWYGHIPLLILTGIIIGFGITEIINILSKTGLKPALWLAVIGEIILLGSACLYYESGLGTAMIVILILCLISIVILYPSFSPLDGAVTLLATFYIGLAIFLYLLHTLPDGRVWLAFMLACTWANDTAAYFAGKAVGKHSLLPVLSPAKTVEGAMAGVLANILVASFFFWLYPEGSFIKMLILGILVGVAAQVGDLVESAFKRQAGVKDAGNLIPGHGGVLDRFDSVLFTAPLVYYFVGLFIVKLR